MQNVILLTLDGVRWDEFFAGSSVLPGEPVCFPHFWSRLASRFIIYGDCDQANRMEAPHPSLVSLPGYQTILSGRIQPGMDNDCGRVAEETVLERVARALGPDEVAVYASWEKVALAAASREGACRVEAGPTPSSDRPPWPECRWDQETFAAAMAHLRRRPPRFLYVSLGDSDDWGHLGSREGYLGALAHYDRWIAELVAWLEGVARSVTLLITTDHGRGEGEDWPEHGAQWPHSRKIWLAALHLGGGDTPKPPVGRFDQRSIRPTIEALLGLNPVGGEGRRPPFEEVLGLAGVGKRPQ